MINQASRAAPNREIPFMDRRGLVKENLVRASAALSVFQIISSVVLALLFAGLIAAIVVASIALHGVNKINSADDPTGHARIMSTSCVSIEARTDPSTQAVPAGSFFVRTQGKYNPNKPFVLLFHGTSASHNYWRSSAEVLANDLFVVMMDIRGHGQSVKTPAFSPSNSTNQFRYTYELFALDAMAVLDEMGLSDSQFACGGISIGSSICLELSTRYPELVTHNILVNGAPLFRCADLSIDGSVSGCAPDQPGDIAPWLTGIPTNITTLLPEDVYGAYPDTCNLTDARAKINQNRAVSTVAVQSLIRYAQTVDQTPILDDVKCPTLVVVGLADITNGIEAAEALHAGISNSVVLQYPGRGHLMPMTQGPDLGKQMVSFILGKDVWSETKRALDSGCQMSSLIAPETDFTDCA